MRLAVAPAAARAPSTGARKQALLLLGAHGTTVDRAVLRGKARANKVEDLLRRLDAGTRTYRARSPTSLR